MPGPESKPTSFSDIGLAAAAGIVASLFKDDHLDASDVLPRIPGFVLSGQLGKGGGGAVYLGHREGSEVRLAIKIINNRFGRDDAGGKRAWRELELLEQLRLPALPRMIDYGVTDGRLYMATEFVEGLPLDRHCEDRQLDRRKRVELLAHVADAVHSLHEHGVIHRDIKPSNILIDSNDRPFIIDLGIATLFAQDARETLTVDGVPIGSPAFMSPEQARGERTQLSTRADVYGLGATAYLLLTGRTPHDANSTISEVIRRVAQDPPSRPRALDPTLPKPLAAVLEMAVNPVPSGRYASAASFAADLRRWLRGEPVMASSAGVWTRTIRWAATNPGRLSAISFVIFLLATVALIGISTAYVTWYNRKPFRFDVTVDSGGKENGARLLSHSGNELAVLGGAKCSLQIAELVEVPKDLGGGQRAVICASQQTGSSAQTTDGQLWVCEPSDLTRPLWKTDPDEFTVPAYPHPYEELWQPQLPLFRFTVLAATVADVFPEIPGPEIIVSHASAEGTPHAIRIYSLRGRDGRPEVLFECWHFGPVRGFAWWQEKSLLFCTGDRHGRDTHTWEKIMPGCGITYRPLVIFPIKPVLDRKFGWIMNEDEATEGPKDPPSAVVPWYKSLGPVEAGKDYQPKIAAKRGAFQGQGIQAIFLLRRPDGTLGDGFNWVIDENGDRISPTEVGDQWVHQFLADKPGDAQAEAERHDLRDFPGWFIQRWNESPQH